MTPHHEATTPTSLRHLLNCRPSHGSTTALLQPRCNACAALQRLPPSPPTPHAAVGGGQRTPRRCSQAPAPPYQWGQRQWSEGGAAGHRHGWHTHPADGHAGVGWQRRVFPPPIAPDRREPWTPRTPPGFAISRDSGRQSAMSHTSAARVNPLSPTLIRRLERAE